ncbi:MAG: damage-inducible protein DinB [Alphaproteobacteria bacterium]|nr:damage-inducible protein DinB [Alphaproteobacteria bacterium]
MNTGYFTLLAQYNAWANRRLYEACESLSVSEYMRERPSFFGSLHATLNHILVADRIWLARIEGQTPLNLEPDQILYGDLVGLKMARLAEDERIRIVVSGLLEERLDQPMEYRNATGDRYEAPLRLVLGHLFNHQTHHRGQAHGLLSQTTVLPPSLDLTAFARRGPET